MLKEECRRESGKQLVQMVKENKTDWSKTLQFFAISLKHIYEDTKEVVEKNRTKSFMLA